jgi:hypothetical protein
VALDLWSAYSKARRALLSAREKRLTLERLLPGAVNSDAQAGMSAEIDRLHRVEREASNELLKITGMILAGITAFGAILWGMLRYVWAANS